MNNQRLCMLDRYPRKNLASFVLAGTLCRLSADAERCYNDPVLLVETFTDTSSCEGTCYKAQSFVLIGSTSRYARRNGTSLHHRQEKCVSVYPLRTDTRSLLAAPFDHPIIATRERRTSMVDLFTVVIDGQGGLYARLCKLKDHRKKKGIRHKLAAVLLVCATSMLCGAKGAREITE